MNIKSFCSKRKDKNQALITDNEIRKIMIIHYHIKNDFYKIGIINRDIN